MAEDVALRRPAARAERVFALAEALGRLPDGEGSLPTSVIEHAREFGELWEALRLLLPEIKAPPKGFEKVAESLRQTALTVRSLWNTLPEEARRRIRASHASLPDVVADPIPRSLTTDREFSTELQSASRKGFAALRECLSEPRTDDPFAELAESRRSTAERLGPEWEECELGDGTIGLLERANGLLLDEIVVGPTLWRGNHFPIHDFDARVVRGDAPSVCPKAARPLGVEWLPRVVEAFRRCGYLGPGQTVHWTGGEYRLENVCTCWGIDGMSEAPIGLASSARRRRGRRAPDRAAIEEEARIAAEWKRSHEAHVAKAVFAKDRGMSLRDLCTLLDRVRHREKSRNKAPG